MALVYFGGVSLAVYMHGVSKELLKLARASKQLHGIANRAERLRAEHAESHPGECDTESVYFDLLREIGRTTELRVVIDIVSGASAGGINGVLLARALAHDLPVDSLRELWLAQADVSELLAEDSRATRYSKIVLKPLIWVASKTGLIELARDAEVRDKVSLFVRSRWFKPPFSGLRMSDMLYTAMTGMGDAKDGRSLIPAGQPLELFIPITDFYGAQRDIALHDPPQVTERDHRHTLKFVYRRDYDGAVQTDFDLEGVPALTFAARATSSFPGAFPPAQLGEIERLLAKHDGAWTGRARFLDGNFAAYLRGNLDPGATSFIDGSVLNNKPFERALRSIDGRPAFRQVDRRLVYVDPDPARPPPPPSGKRPGFFSTLKGALSDIPRNEPIGRELQRVNEHNAQVRRQRGVIDGTRPYVEQLVGDIADADTGGPWSRDHVTTWREASNELAVIEAGYAFEGYARQNIVRVMGDIGGILRALSGSIRHRLPEEWFARVAMHWGYRRGVLGQGSITRRSADEMRKAAWVWFLLTYDIGFRKRRLRFMIQIVNRLYQQHDDGAQSDMAIELFDWLKRRLYDQIDILNRRERTEFYAPEIRARAKVLFGHAERGIRPKVFVAAHADALGGFIEELGQAMALDAASIELDGLMASLSPADWPPPVRRELLINYIGFTFWDVMTFPITNVSDLGEFDEIKVDRISPRESRWFGSDAADSVLKGTQLAHFGAFFSRAYRENDYLWGRLHAVERVLDIVADAAGPAMPGGKAALDAWKRRAFLAVIAAEKPYLKRIDATLARIEAALAAAAAKGRP